MSHRNFSTKIVDFLDYIWIAVPEFFNTPITKIQFAMRMFALATIIFVLSFMVRGCTMLLASTSIVPQKVMPDISPAKQTKHEFTVTMALDAVLRATSSDKVCYDEAENSIFMHFTGVPNAAPDSAEERNGWYAMKNTPMHYSSNGSWYIEDVNSIPDIRVHPDITNLECKVKGA